LIRVQKNTVSWYSLILLDLYDVTNSKISRGGILKATIFLEFLVFGVVQLSVLVHSLDIVDSFLDDCDR
jgi:hypothetical protein